jgi:hypothetical protein
VHPQVGPITGTEGGDRQHLVSTIRDDLAAVSGRARRSAGLTFGAHTDTITHMTSHTAARRLADIIIIR